MTAVDVARKRGIAHFVAMRRRHVLHGRHLPHLLRGFGGVPRSAVFHRNSRERLNRQAQDKQNDDEKSATRTHGAAV